MRENMATVLEVVADVEAEAAADAASEDDGGERRRRPAVVHGAVRRDRQELDERAARLAGHLAAAGIGPGDRVAIALYNGPEIVETILAVMKLRCATVNINYRYRERELFELLGESGAAALVMDAALTPVVAAVADRLPRLRTIVRLGTPAAPAGRGADDYERVLRAVPPMPRVQRSGDDEWLVFTGGTTGRPKGVVSRHADIVTRTLRHGYPPRGLRPPADLAELRAAARRLVEDGPRSVMLVAPPLMHGTGLYAAVGALLVAGTVVFLTSRSYDADEMAGLIKEHAVTELCIVGDAFARPFAATLDRAAAAGRPYDLSSLRRVISAGATWSTEAKRRLLRHCAARLDDVVGATEGGPFAFSVMTRDRDAVTSRFELVPGVRVIDADGADIVPGSGRVGRLAAPVSARTHYLNDPGKNATTFRDIGGRRYCVPGDMATIEADGTVTLLGRDNRMINTGGEKVFAEEVEQVIAQHPDIDDVYVIGVPDEFWGQRIAAVVAARPGARLAAADVRALVTAELADFKQPREVVFVPRLRRSPAGKPDLAWAGAVVGGTAPPEPPEPEPAQPEPAGPES